LINYQIYSIPSISNQIIDAIDFFKEYKKGTFIVKPQPPYSLVFQCTNAININRQVFELFN